MFFYSSPSWVAYALENILALKLLHDRGFNIGLLGEFVEGFVGRFLDIMFGQGNVTWKEISVNLPAEMANISKDSDEYFMLQEFLSRAHYDVKIKIKGIHGIIQSPQVEKSLIEILQKLVPTKDEYLDDVFPWYEFFVSTSWLKEKNQITGIRFHFADVVGGCFDDEAPASSLPYLKIFIEFWDRLMQERSANKCLSTSISR